MTTTTIAVVFYITFLAFPPKGDTTTTSENRPFPRWEMEMKQKITPEAMVENYNIPGVGTAVKNCIKIKFR